MIKVALDLWGEDLFENKKRGNKAERRQAVYKYLADFYGLGPTAIGATVGRSHATVIYGLRTINGLIDIKEESAVEAWTELLGAVFNNRERSLG